MIGYTTRGFSFTRALLGLVVDELHLCGDPTAVPIIQEMLKVTGDNVEVEYYERLSPLIPLRRPLGSFLEIQRGDCIVAFSRPKIYSIKMVYTTHIWQIDIWARFCCFFGVCGPDQYRYLQPLSMALEAEKWSLVQPLLSSSYSGYGTSSLKQDALELDQLISYLINKEGSEGVVLLGHSTGCQDIAHYMRSNIACSKVVQAAILQAPDSDQEYRATLPNTTDMIDLAASMIKEDKAMHLMPREANPDAPITTYMYYSLCAYMGDDDMFSSDLSDDQL